MSTTQPGVAAPEPIGALARITPSLICAALQLPTAGRLYDLGLEIHEGMPAGPATPFSRAFSITPEGSGGSGRFQFAAEVISANLHSSSHIDGLVHVQSNDRIYGGELARDCRDDRGWKKYGMETVAPIISRCLLLDIAGLHDREALADGYAISVDDIRNACAAATLTVRNGDVVLVRTGKIRDFFQHPQQYGRNAPGISPEAAVWLYEQGMAVLGMDAPGIDPLPFPDPAHTTHHAMLVERGVHLIENLYLDAALADGVKEALFLCMPLKFTGGTGSWVRPVAVV